MLERVIDGCRAIEDGIRRGVVDDVLPHRVPADRATRRGGLVFRTVRPNRRRTEDGSELTINPGGTANKGSSTPRGILGPLRLVHALMVRRI